MHEALRDTTEEAQEAAAARVPFIRSHQPGFKDDTNFPGMRHFRFSHLPVHAHSYSIHKRCITQLRLLWDSNLCSQLNSRTTSITPLCVRQDQSCFCWVTKFYANSPWGFQSQNARWGQMLRTLPNFHLEPHSTWLIKSEWYLDIYLVRNLNSLNIKLWCIYVSHVAVFWCIPCFIHIPTVFSEDFITIELFYRILVIFMSCVITQFQTSWFRSPYITLLAQMITATVYVNRSPLSLTHFAGMVKIVEFSILWDRKNDISIIADLICMLLGSVAGSSATADECLPVRHRGLGDS